jgi:hypothetical protein
MKNKKNTMMKTLVTTLCLSAVCLFTLGCKDDKDPVSVYEYHAHIRQPDTSPKQLNDTMHIEIDFESHTGQPVHHIRIGILDLQSLNEVYMAPVDFAVNDPDGDYRFEDDVVLSAANGFHAGTWTLEASIWGPADGEELETETVTFTIQ